MGLFSSDDNKRNTTTKKNWHKSPTEFHKGGYKLHVTGRHHIVAVETPDGELALFEDWEGVLAKIWQITPFGSTNFKELEKRADRRVSGLPRCNLRADGSQYSRGKFTSNIAVIEMTDDEIVLEPHDKAAKDLLGSIEGVKIREREIGDFSSIK